MNAERAGGRHAVVVGGSMAGMLAARVLADHFERVTLLERDRYAEDGPVPRRGVTSTPCSSGGALSSKGSSRACWTS